MRSQPGIILAVAAAIVCTPLGDAHEIPVHLKITAAAIVLSTAFQNYYTDNNIDALEPFTVTHNNYTGTGCTAESLRNSWGRT